MTPEQGTEAKERKAKKKKKKQKNEDIKEGGQRFN
jgi:hypothetical protein